MKMLMEEEAKKQVITLLYFFLTLHRLKGILICPHHILPALYGLL